MLKSEMKFAWGFGTACYHSYLFIYNINPYILMVMDYADVLCDSTAKASCLW